MTAMRALEPHPSSDMGELVARLRQPISVRTSAPVNPDGPEAADLIEHQATVIAERDATIERLRRESGL